MKYSMPLLQIFERQRQVFAGGGERPAIKLVHRHEGGNMHLLRMLVGPCLLRFVPLRLQHVGMLLSPGGVVYLGHDLSGECVGGVFVVEKEEI